MLARLADEHADRKKTATRCVEGTPRGWESDMRDERNSETKELHPDARVTFDVAVLGA
jgi:hypothetical protein